MPRRPPQRRLYPPPRPPRRGPDKGIIIGSAVLAFVVIGGCASILGIGNEASTTGTEDCAMAPAAAQAPGRIGGGWGNGGGDGGGDGGLFDGDDSSSGGTGEADLPDTPDYEPAMNPSRVTADMRAQAEVDHGEMREVGDEFVYFDKRTDKPFPWHKKAYAKAKEAARKAEASETAAADEADTAEPTENTCE